MQSLQSCWPGLQIQACSYRPDTCPMRAGGAAIHTGSASALQCLRIGSRHAMFERLSACVSSADDMAVLRQLVGCDGTAVYRLSDHAVVERITNLVMQHVICLLERGRPRFPIALATSSPPSTATVSALRQSSARPTALEAAVPPLSQSTETLHWIEIELVGIDDGPIAGAEYTLETPTGELICGRLDQAGYARIDQLPTGGQCRVSFPALDRDAWEFVQALPAKTQAMSQRKGGPHAQTPPRERR